MIGVVLWSDPVSGSAVIWCDHQGDLAYFDAADGAVDVKPAKAASLLDAGDLVEFDPVVSHTRLVAQNPRSLKQERADMVGQSAPQRARALAPMLRDKSEQGEVVDLAAHKLRQQVG